MPSEPLSRRRWGTRLIAGAVLALARPVLAATKEPVRLIVMDPLALPLSCSCVPGTGQRRYSQLAVHLKKVLGRPVTITFEESLALALELVSGPPHLIVGKDSVVRFDARKRNLPVRPLAALTDRAGATELKGVFLVRQTSTAKSLADLAGKIIALGPVEDEETHGAAQRALAAAKSEAKVKSFGSMDAAALALADGEADAAVVSDFLPPLLEGCGKLDKGSVRVLAATDAVPFSRVFATDAVDAALEKQIADALAAVSKSPALLAALESKAGFVSLRPEPVMEWADWRGPGRKGFVPQLPRRLLVQPKRLWSAPLTGPAMAGPAATTQFVLVPDKTADAKRDLFRCLKATNGKEVWRLEYSAPDELDYSNAPRATPVIHDGLAYLQGALGHLHCVELATGKVVWKAHLFDEFRTPRLTWGASVSPLVLDDKLIIAPGAKEASVVALDRRTGKVIWKTPGHAAAYSAFIHGNFDGVAQVIGYDVASLGGWDPQTGRRLWELVPPAGADFNVTTPVVVGSQLLLAAENNATRLHAFDRQGRLVATPTLKNKDLAPDTCTPAVVNGKVFATAYGDMFCLDLSTGLKTLWRVSNDMFHDHVTLVAGPDRVLVWTIGGDLLLLDATGDRYQVISHLRPFPGKAVDSMAHPAFVGDRLYLRSPKELLCLRLGE
ncbi:MAG: PQQ-dependent dehydrogenase [Limisphaerales bacterium]|nr:MAG: PQQ-dependent dehydrogenase [Limisphaerales bacterium]TXT45680.1 MAG: PQQ-dependent dehydrogenase [Limisphaerales bacterium]